jgi:parallel beta-helix repeat protein
MAIGGKSSPLVADNQITQNKDGLFIDDSASPVLRNNVIKNNSQDGMVVTLAAQPDLGTAESPGQNVIRSNGKYDVQNATKNTLVAVANDIDKRRISGKVDFVAAQVAFQDIQQNYWAQPYIKALAAKKIIAGFPDGTFKPDQPVTRAQFAAIVSKAFSPTDQRPPLNFTDVSSNFWAYQPIESAYRGGFMTGYPGGTFQPDQQRV